MKTKSINTHCPWSGDTVSETALTTYKGVVVGFCNPGCRDKFDRATQAFDADIASQVSRSDAGAAPSAYKARRFQFSDVWTVNDLRLKMYTITQQGDDRDMANVLSTAKQYTEQTLPNLREEEGPDHALGYGMIHVGQMGTWLLLHWWAHEDVALRHLAVAKNPLDPEFQSQDHRRYHACVWEHLVIDHERHAWVRRMMTSSPGEADYLAERLADQCL